MLRGTVAAAMLAGIASAAGAAARYEPANLFGTGYADEAVSPGVWKVRGASATRDGGHAIALYRAAQLGQAAGVAELRIVQQRITVMNRVDRRTRQPIMFVREVAHITVRAVRGDADRVACEEKEARRCVTVSVARLLAQFGPGLGQSPGPRPELAAARPAVTTGVALPPALIEAIARRQAAAAAAQPVAAPVVRPLPLAQPLPVAPPLPVAFAPPSAVERALSPYELGRLAGASARAASQPDG